MTIDCPVPTCHEERTIVANKVKDLESKYNDQKDFNEDICSHLKRYMKKPSSPVMIAFFSLILIPSFLVIVNLITENQTSEYIYAKAETVSQLDKRVAIMEEQISTLNKNMNEIKESLKSVKIETKEQFDELKATVNQQTEDTKKDLGDIKRLLRDRE